ncbi:MAG: radical SAM protein [Spirochaetes bacterium]|jgi:histone acetyltransferase (RNA polymerase elongator complex component)|nr:radical SAM protein [Spirochaetota bacterium]
MPKQQITVPIFIPHLGCRHRCVFCNQWQQSGAKILPDRNSIERTINEHLGSRNPGVGRVEVAFFGGSFTGIDPEKQREFLEIVSPYVSGGIINGIRISTRPDYISVEAVALLRDYGVDMVEIGAQSFDDRVLESSARGHSSADIFRAVEILKKIQMKFCIQLLPGLPSDTREKSLKSAKTACNMKPEAVRLYPAVVMKNTGLEVLYKSGGYEPLCLEDAVELCKDMHLIFMADGISVIRTGIHPLSKDDEKNIIAGPYHPSFGFLVKSRIKRDLLVKAIRETTEEGKINSVKLYLPFIEKEEYIGQKKLNISYLRNFFNLKEITCEVVRGDGLRVEGYSI